MQKTGPNNFKAKPCRHDMMTAFYTALTGCFLLMKKALYFVPQFNRKNIIFFVHSNFSPICIDYAQCFRPWYTSDNFGVNHVLFSDCCHCNCGNLVPSLLVRNMDLWRDYHPDAQHSYLRTKDRVSALHQHCEQCGYICDANNPFRRNTRYELPDSCQSDTVLQGKETLGLAARIHEYSWVFWRGSWRVGSSDLRAKSPPGEA